MKQEIEPKEYSPEFEILIAGALEINKKDEDKYFTRPFMIEFKVNGVDLDFRAVAKNLYDAFNRDVEERAVKLLMHKHGDVAQALDDLAEKIRKKT